MFNKYAGSIVRHALTVMAGVLATVGVNDMQVQQFVAINSEIILAVIVYGIGQGLSFLKEQKNSK